ncbi:MAG: UDP-N-acetylglucosamine 2-epimerase (non-hydrolyzing), partial [Holophagales bacterium]|nr:UDP-N-acetylglucosamine 2-epimerase (non-hydrolyzing) [Holophagales bacterium]
QTLPELTSRLLTGLSAVIEAERPAAVLVQGDTATTLAGALAAFYARVPVGHVEAGLRSGRLDQPFPEEGSRRIVDVLATWSFAPTERCRQALLREGRDPESIFVTGNTVVDALQEVRSRLGDWPIENHRDCLGTAWQAVVENDGPLLFVTVHRRESFGPGIEAVCAAIERLAEERAELRVVFPVHLNPAVQGPIHRRLGGLPNVHLLEPVPYDLCLRLMARATLILSDSGGIQEEAPSLGTPLLVAREVSERGEGLDAGVAHLVGTDPERIVREATRLLDDAAARQAMIGRPNPYGDGHAASRIAAVLAKALGAFPEAGGVLS